MLNSIGVEMLEAIIINELCEWNGREKLKDLRIRIIPLVRTLVDDAVS